MKIKKYRTNIAILFRICRRNTWSGGTRGCITPLFIDAQRIRELEGWSNSRNPCSPSWVREISSSRLSGEKIVM